MKKILLIILIFGLVQWWLKDPTVSARTNDVTFGYIAKYSGNSTRNDKLPMLVALHGNGDTAKNFYNTALDQINVPVRIVLLKGPIPYSRGSAWPWSAADFTKFGTAVSGAIELLTVRYPTARKPILLGFSGGAMMAYYQAVKHGNRYSYIFPVSGGLSNKLLGNESSRPGAKVHAFHGRNDSVVSIYKGKNAVNILRAKGIDVRFTEFDGGHHGIFLDMKPKITQAIEQELKGR